MVLRSKRYKKGTDEYSFVDRLLVPQQLGIASCVSYYYDFTRSQKFHFVVIGIVYIFTCCQVKANRPSIKCFYIQFFILNVIFVCNAKNVSWINITLWWHDVDYCQIFLIGNGWVIFLVLNANFPIGNDLWLISRHMKIVFSLNMMQGKWYRVSYLSQNRWQVIII